ncbi:translation initiation factor IF-2 isoform X1 [Osmerus eperlanus]|uniref:translation initiation factor IF-2 isoform X1 n=1 Tax=Osmerus eperlanus TaxID=29151 RepID=UPI002E15C47C
MGPIMQERTASTTLKRVTSKEKIRVKNAENNGPINPSSKKVNKVKKAGSQLKNGLPSPGHNKDTVPTAQKTTQYRGSRVKSDTARNTTKLSSPQEEGVLKPKPHKLSLAPRKDERREVQRASPCCAELDQNRGAMSRSRRALSLPLSSPIPGLHQGPTQALTHIHIGGSTLESLRHYESKEDDTDSASDLSDSERLPVLPSPCTPCTPPHLNLRAEVINSNDFPPDFPGPGGASAEDSGDAPSYSYPDFLPPPFNTWSLRQLAVFLHTEGRGAPRPKPVGPLEKYLERLLQLEWLQIQTLQMESGSKPSGLHPRPLGFPSATATQLPRPHTAPPTRLNSPKGPRQSHRTFPFAPVNNPPSPASAQQHFSRLPVCPHCNIRYPLCNGSCSAYAYQRHSRLSPLLERRARPGAPAKRSSSETRAASSEGRAPGSSQGGAEAGGGGAHTPGSPSAGRSHMKHIQAAGNARKPSQEPGANGNGKGQAGTRKGRVRTSSETERRKEPSGVRGVVGVEKRVNSGSKREVNTIKRAERDCQKSAEVGGAQAAKTGIRKTSKEVSSFSRAPIGDKQNVKAKNVVAK